MCKLKLVINEKSVKLEILLEIKIHQTYKKYAHFTLITNFITINSLTKYEIYKEAYTECRRL